jgi:hypothetical protein
MPRFLTPIDLSNLEIKNVLLQYVPTVSLPASNLAGQILFDSTVNRPKWNSGSGWVDIYPSSELNTANTEVRRDGFGNFAANTITASLSGNASTATSLQTSRNFSITGKATAATVAFNGTGDVSLNITSLGVLPGDITLSNGQFILGNGSGVGAATNKSSIPLSGFGAATADVAMGGFKITGLADPTNAQDAATKSYVDAMAVGLDVKQSCRVGTTASLASTYTAGNKRLTGTANVAIAIDGIPLSLNDRVLVKNQTTASENGIYTVIQVGDTYTPWILQRSGDFDTSAKASPGSFVFIEDGTTLSDTGWVMTANAPVTLDTTAITWAQFSGQGTYLAGNGIVLSGSTWHFAQSSAYTVNTIPIATGTSTIGFISAGSANQVLRVPSGGGAPAFGAVDISQAAAVTGVLGAGNGGTSQSSWVTGDLLYASATNTLARRSIGSAGQVLIVSSGLPSWGLVSLTASVTGVLPVSNGGTNLSAVTNGGVLIGSAGGYAFTAAMSAGQVIMGNASGVPTPTTLTGDVTTSSAGVLTIGNNAVTYSKFQQIPGLSVFGNSAGSSANGGAISGSANQVLRVDSAGTALGFGAISLASSSAVTGTLPVANGGTGINTLAIGDIIYASSTTSFGRLPLGGQYTVLKSNGSSAPFWGKVDLNNDVSSVLPPGSGGTGNQFFDVDGPTTSVKIFTFRDANSVIPAFVSGTISGNGSSTQFSAAHSLGTKNVVVSLYDSNDDQVYTDTKTLDNNTVRFTFATAPSNGTNFRWVVVGY